MYLVSDDYGNFKEIMNYKQLKELLIDELIRDTRENIDFENKDVMELNIKQLGELAKDNIVSLDYIKDNLKSYGWSVLNILDVQKGLNDIREYVARKSTGVNIKVFDDILKYIDEELK